MRQLTANCGSPRKYLASDVATEHSLILDPSDSPETFHYLEATSQVPQVTTNFKPQVKVLSRKPLIAKRDPVTGLTQMSLEDDGDADAKKEVVLSPEEIRAKQKRDREEKQRRYEEARAKIFGESAPSSGTSSPGTTTPPRAESRSQGRGRGRGNGSRNSDNRQFDSRRAPAPNLAAGRELFDPNYAPKQEQSTGQRRDIAFQGRGAGPRTEQPQQQPQQAIRAPRGPDGSGRGGFGFARRGGTDA